MHPSILRTQPWSNHIDSGVTIPDTINGLPVTVVGDTFAKFSFVVGALQERAGLRGCR